MTQNMFQNEQYEALARDIIGDVFYADQSYRGKIARERQYAELIVRKLLDVAPNDKMTIGQKAITDKINALPDSGFILNAISSIQLSGNDTTHTQVTREFTKADYDTVTDSLFDLLASLLINYFSKYKFGSRTDVMNAFSLLPPLIRRKVLMYLYSKDDKNVAVIDKLALAILKADGKNEALKWLEDRKSTLSAQKAVYMDFYEKAKSERGAEYADFIYNIAPTMYESCLEKIIKVGNAIEQQGALYLTFEAAKPYYEQRGILDGYDDESREFNDIMEFLYLGRHGEEIDFIEPVVIMSFQR